MTTNYHEEITKLLDSAGLIDKTLSFGCLCKDPAGQLFMLVDDSKEKVFDVCYQSFGATLVSKEVFIEILGHPWDLREVMAWFMQYGDALAYRKKYKDMYLATDMEVRPSHFLIDISKPLSQQDLKSLYELMKSISDNK